MLSEKPIVVLHSMVMVLERGGHGSEDGEIGY